jgi:trehalose/maltose hydrolase-like predicted phosphorylase
MQKALEPTKDPTWFLSHEGYNVLSESAVESRLAFGNGFLGMRAARSVSRGPTWECFGLTCREMSNWW